MGGIGRDCIQDCALEAIFTLDLCTQGGLSKIAIRIKFRIFYLVDHITSLGPPPNSYHQFIIKLQV